MGRGSGAVLRGAGRWLALWLMAGLLAAGAVSVRPSAGGLLDWQPAERAQVLSLGPWPPAPAADPSNRVSGRPQAIAFGEALFHSTRLSRVPGLRCASCHEPWRQFTDGRRTGLGAAAGDRNTPTLLNIAQQRWFGWDGANDNLWAQSIRPLLDEREMRADPAFIGAQLRADDRLRTMYRASFDREPPADDTTVMVDLAKALAAYQETLVSERTPFDAFRDALANGDHEAAARYPMAAQRGLRLFVGKAQCIACHAGPAFSDGRFHASLVRSQRHGGEPDTGRNAGLKRLADTPFALAGRFNDGPQRSVPEPAGDGAFRTPPLRELAATAPYMHDGSVARLCDALQPHATPPAATPPPTLQRDERRELIAFLLSLSARGIPAHEDTDGFDCR
jgi:cytochrome c peroxidase